MLVRTIKVTRGPDGNGAIEERPIGTEIEHPDAWMLCVSDVASAEPVDDEAKERVARGEEALQSRRALVKRGIAAKVKKPGEAKAAEPVKVAKNSK